MVAIIAYHLYNVIDYEERLTCPDKLQVALVKLNPLLHFGLCNGTKSSPKVRFFSPQRVIDELRGATREFFENEGIEVDLEKRTVHLTRIFKW